MFTYTKPTLQHLFIVAILLICILSGYFLHFYSETQDDTTLPTTAELNQDPPVRISDPMDYFNETVIEKYIETLIHQSLESNDELIETPEEPSTKNHRRVKYPNRHFLLINRHYGLGQDMKYLANKLNFTLDEMSREDLFGEIKDIRDTDFLTQDETRKTIVSRLADWVCDRYPIVFVADVNGDGRFLLQKLDQHPTSCKMKKLIFITTNRFDYHTSHCSSVV